MNNASLRQFSRKVLTFNEHEIGLARFGRVDLLDT